MPFREDFGSSRRRADFSHDCLGDFRAMVFGSSHASFMITAFIDHVIDVRLLGAAEQVSGIDTRSVVAMM
jgi:hypothetical protein